jgi:Na+/proline symporter
LAIYLANITGFVVGGLGLAALYRQMRVVTVAEVLRLRFGKITEQIIASLVVLNNIIWSGVVLYGLSVFSRMIFPGVDPLIITVVVGLVVLVYCMVGGTWAVMANDFVQGLIMISMTILLTVICFVKAGGICGFFEAISSNPVTAREFQFVTPSEPGTFWTARYGLTWILAAFLAQFS